MDGSECIYVECPFCNGTGIIIDEEGYEETSRPMTPTIGSGSMRTTAPMTNTNPFLGWSIRILAEFASR